MSMCLSKSVEFKDIGVTNGMAGHRVSGGQEGHCELGRIEYLELWYGVNS